MRKMPKGRGGIDNEWILCYTVVNQSSVVEKQSRVRYTPWAFDCLFTIFCSMQQGTIARLTDKGFGFIAREGEQKDLFFHANDLEGTAFADLRQGDAVTFEVAEGPKGLNAIKVSKV